MMQENLFPPGAPATVDPLDAPGGKPAEFSAAEEAQALDVLSRGLADVIAKRVEQIVRYGHTPEQDAELPLRFFANEIRVLGQMIADDSTFALKLSQMRRHAVKLSAMAVAMIDRIDVEIAREAAADEGR